MIQAPAVPHLHIPRRPNHWETHADPASWPWDDIPALPPFILEDGSGPAIQQTVARICYDASKLYVRFDCRDRDIWGNYTERDDPIYDEEAVELFLAPGAGVPARYYEFEVSPNGVLFDAVIDNPHSRRSDMQADFGWNCAGLYWSAGRNDQAEHWWALLAIPWQSIGAIRETPLTWRANLYRIERPRDAAPEFSCWSPTVAQDFHKPKRFGVLTLEG